jgi:hypothetical protein
MVIRRTGDVGLADEHHAAVEVAVPQKPGDLGQSRAPRAVRRPQHVIEFRLIGPVVSGRRKSSRQQRIEQASRQIQDSADETVLSLVVGQHRPDATVESVGVCVGCDHRELQHVVGVVVRIVFGNVEVTAAIGGVEMRLSVFSGAEGEHVAKRATGSGPGGIGTVEFVAIQVVSQNQLDEARLLVVRRHSLLDRHRLGGHLKDGQKEREHQQRQARSNQHLDERVSAARNVECGMRNAELQRGAATVV